MRFKEGDVLQIDECLFAITGPPFELESLQGRMIPCYPCIDIISKKINYIRITYADSYAILIELTELEKLFYEA